MPRRCSADPHLAARRRLEGRRNTFLLLLCRQQNASVTPPPLLLLLVLLRCCCLVRCGRFGRCGCCWWRRDRHAGCRRGGCCCGGSCWPCRQQDGRGSKQPSSSRCHCWQPAAGRGWRHRQPLLLLELLLMLLLLMLMYMLLPTITATAAICCIAPRHQGWPGSTQWSTQQPVAAQAARRRQRCAGAAACSCAPETTSWSLLGGKGRHQGRPRAQQARLHGVRPAPRSLGC